MKNYLAVSMFGLILASAVGTAYAQQNNPMMNQSGPGMMQGQGSRSQSMPAPFHSGGNMMPYYNGQMGDPNMMNRGDWHDHMRGSGMMMGGMMNPDMMIIMLDSDNDGKLSQEEFQAVHNRMFKYLDKDGDGKLSSDEIMQRHDWDEN